MEKKNRVLLVCVYNSGPSRMVEALLRSMGGERFEVESACTEPDALNSPAVEEMAYMGIYISKNRTQSVFDLCKAGRLYTYVITVCDVVSAQRCPIYPGVVENIHWCFDDSSFFAGSHEEKLKKTIDVRDEIEQEIEKLIAEAL